MTARRTPDTSVVVAGLSSWHTHHDIALPILAASPPAIQHVVAESYSVLTRLSKGRGVEPKLALVAVMSAFNADRLALTSAQMEAMMVRLAAANIGGGATYDAIVAESARLANVELVTLDKRATRTYDAVGVHFTLLEEGGI